jgi:hypothetical protein
MLRFKYAISKVKGNYERLELDDLKQMLVMKKTLF